jgi:hypothetical protein
MSAGATVTALPASIPTRPISTMHMVKTQTVRQPQRYCCLLRPIADYWHYRPAARIDAIILGTIAISWNDIRIPVWFRSGRDDDNPREFRLRAGYSNEWFRATQQGRSDSERYGHYLHASTSLPTTVMRFRFSRRIIACDIIWQMARRA